MRHDDPSMIDLVTAMDLVPGVFTFCGEKDTQQAEGFSVSFTLERAPVGFRALELLTWACSEMAYAQQGREEVKASYKYAPFTEGKILCFELCGSGNPKQLAAYIRSMSRTLTMVRELRLHVAGG
jgi:hypothetical protein